MQEYSGGTRHKKGEKMRLEFSIVLFENEGYATARRNTGINEILASKAGMMTAIAYLRWIHTPGNGGLIPDYIVQIFALVTVLLLNLIATIQLYRKES